MHFQSKIQVTSFRRYIQGVHWEAPHLLMKIVLLIEVNNKCILISDLKDLFLQKTLGVLTE